MIEKVGKYEILGKIGEGATATVYLARDPFAGRDVAVKVFSPETLRDKHRGRVFQHLLMNEAALAGKLMHPHIVQIHDAAIGDCLKQLSESGSIASESEIAAVGFKTVVARLYDLIAQSPGASVGRKAAPPSPAPAPGKAPAARKAKARVPARSRYSGRATG